MESEIYTIYYHGNGIGCRSITVRKNNEAGGERMKKAGKSILKMLGTMAEKQADGKEGWPPECFGLAYQPKRPACKERRENKYLL